jgi:hypothetical protein
MTSLMVTMTDVFYALGDFCLMIFRGMRVMGHGPNVILWIIIISLIGWQITRMIKENKEADRNGTLR